MSAYVHQEMSQEQATQNAAKLPMPSFDGEKEEMDVAQEFVVNRQRQMACYLMGLSDAASVKSQWKAYRRDYLERKRYYAYLKEMAAQWDANRGKYLVMVQQPDVRICPN
jgi:hypothetical protein